MPPRCSPILFRRLVSPFPFSSIAACQHFPTVSKYQTSIDFLQGATVTGRPFLMIGRLVAGLRLLKLATNTLFVKLPTGLWLYDL